MQVVLASQVASVEQRSVISRMVSGGSMTMVIVGTDGLGGRRLGVDCECCTVGT